MQTRFICLANSLKEGGRCLAGIELEANNNPVLVNEKVKWIRPVSRTNHGEVQLRYTQTFRLLDIIEVDVTENKPKEYQTENVLFNERSIRSNGIFNHAHLEKLCDNSETIFGNNNKALSQNEIVTLNHSLMLVSVNQFEVMKKIYPDRPYHPQIRLVFTYNGNQYDFPVTDPEFVRRYMNNSDLLKEISQLFLCVSLGIAWEGWNYKLVAGIIF